MKRIVTIAVSVVIAASVAAAAEIPLSDTVKKNDLWAGGAFQEENDVFAKGNTDKYYTQGLRFSLMRNPNRNPAFVKKINDALLPEADTDAAWTVGIGQNIYTPDDIQKTAPQMNDRPWGAFLYADNIVQIIDGQERFRHTFELQAGVIGPAAGGNRAQSTIHRWIGSAKPLGWGNQLRNEPAANLIYSYDAHYNLMDHQAIGADLQPYAGGSLGTVMTYADAGAIARFGLNRSGFLNGKLNASAFTRSTGERPHWELWVYAGAEGRGVLHNAFLTGGTFRHIPVEIEQEHFVYDLLSGVSLRYRRWRLTYNRVTRSREFTHPLAVGSGRQNFGSIVFTVEKVLPRG